MASIKVKFRPSATAGREGVVYYQIIHERKIRRVTTGYHIYPSEWDERSSTVKAAAEGGNRRLLIIAVRTLIRRDVDRLARIARKLDEGTLSYTADDLINEFNRYNAEYSLSRFMESMILTLKSNNRIRTAETYKAALLNFKKFLASRAIESAGSLTGDIMLDSLTSEIMEAYEAWQRSRGIAPNTSSFYMRILRAVYNRAVADDIIENRYPFRKVFTGVDKTVKRALPLAVIKKIKALDLSRISELDYARDIFLLSFYLRGMSFIDMAFLKKTDLCNGHIIYRRRKTGRQLHIKWTREMQLTVDKYPENESDYLLPIICRRDTNDRSTYRNKAFNINHALKKIAERMGLGVNLTMYVARHSWASAARAKGIPLSVISEGMGHDSENTTRIYLACLDTSVVDRANSLILKSL